MTSDARRGRRKVILDLRRKAKKLGIDRRSRKYVAWLGLIEYAGRTPDEAKALIDEWDVEELDRLGVAAGEGTL